MERKQKRDENLAKAFVWLAKTKTRQAANDGDPLRNSENLGMILRKRRKLMEFSTGRNIQKSGQALQQLIIAETPILHIPPLLHGFPCKGHFGIKKIQYRSQERFFWPGMKPDVRNWVNSCDQWFRRKWTSQKRWHNFKTWQSCHLFWQVSIKLMGPSPVSAGFNYVWIIGDQFSKWYQAVEMPNQEAQTVARVFVEMGIVRFGCPVKLHSDKATKFMSEISRELCRILGIERAPTTSLHPDGNSLIKWMNKTLEERLSKYVDDHLHELKTYFKLVMMAYRSSIHAATKYSSFYMVLGTLLRLPIDYIRNTS